MMLAKVSKDNFIEILSKYFCGEKPEIYKH